MVFILFWNIEMSSLRLCIVLNVRLPTTPYLLPTTPHVTLHDDYTKLSSNTVPLVKKKSGSQYARWYSKFHFRAIYIPLHVQRYTRVQHLSYNHSCSDCIFDTSESDCHNPCSIRLGAWKACFSGPDCHFITFYSKFGVACSAQQSGLLRPCKKYINMQHDQRPCMQIKCSAWGLEQWSRLSSIVFIASCLTSQFLSKIQARPPLIFTAGWTLY